MDLTSPFERVVIVNLKRRADRRTRLLEALNACDWPFEQPEFFDAIDGSLIPSPAGWQSGGGAWGCMRSHQIIFERAIMDGIQSLLVMEDDACFCDGFAAKVREFLTDVPADWDQLMLGGQHVNLNGKPVLIRPGIYRCSDCERTHCYGIRANFMRKLYQRWSGSGQFNGEVHCDWVMGRDIDMQASHFVYAPEQFLVGQERGRSDVNGGLHPRKFWNPPASDLPVIYLEAPQQTVGELRQYGFHTGFDRDLSTDLDKGLIAAFSEGGSAQERLQQWINEIQWEVASDPFLICTVWHPSATHELVTESSPWPVHHVRAHSVNDAISQLPAALRREHRPLLAQRFVIHFQGPDDVMDRLRLQGWHNGFWRDEASGLDKGLQDAAMLPERQKRDRLKETIAVLQREAEAIHNGVAVIWHPLIDVALVREATLSDVVIIHADNSRDAMDQWEDVKCSTRGNVNRNGHHS